MATCPRARYRVSGNLEAHREHELQYSSCARPSVTLRGAKSVSISGRGRDKNYNSTSIGLTLRARSDNNNISNSSSEYNNSSSDSAVCSPSNSPTGSPTTDGGAGVVLTLFDMEVESRGNIMSTSSTTSGETSETTYLDDSSERNIVFEDKICVDLNKNNLNSGNDPIIVTMSKPTVPTTHSTTKEKARKRRSLVRSASSGICSSISEDTETEDGTGSSDGNESGESNSNSSTGSNSPRLRRPPLQRISAIHHHDSNDLGTNDHLYPGLRCVSPIGFGAMSSGSEVEELETYSGLKTVVRRPRRTGGQNGRTSPSWRWSVMGVGTGDYDAVTRAKGYHPHNPLTSTPTGPESNHGNGHLTISRRSSLGLSATPVSLISPRTNKLSTEFRRLSLQMDMPWRDPNERLLKFSDFLIKRTEELMERSARARQKTYELLRLAKLRQKDRIEF